MSLNKLMKKVFWIYLVLGLSGPVFGQKLRRADKALAADIAKDMTGLRADSMGSAAYPGPTPSSACRYASARFEEIGMVREGDSDSYCRTIRWDEGKIMGKKCALSLDGKAAAAGTDFFPLAGSPDGHSEGSSGISLNEKGLPWIYDLKYDLETGKGSTTGDLCAFVVQKAIEAKRRGATALLLYNSSKISDGLSFDGKDRRAVYAIPVVYISRSLSGKVFRDPTAYVDISLTVSMEEKERYEQNVEGFIDNEAPRTVILRASLDTSDCGAALIELSRLIKQAGWKKHNYLIWGYSGMRDEVAPSLSLHPGLWLDSVDYRVDIDRIMADPANPVLVVTGAFAPDKWASVFQKVKDSYLRVSYQKGGEGMTGRQPQKADCPLFTMSTEGSVMDTGQNGNREALAVRYVFKLMEAAEKQ